MPIRLVVTEPATNAARAYTETNAGAAYAARVVAVAHAVLASVDIWIAPPTYACAFRLAV